MTKLYSEKILSELLDLTPRRIRQLRDEGILKEYQKGYYRLKESLYGYIHYLRQQIGESEMAADLSTERAKLTKARREKAELEVRLRKSELHEAKAIEYIMTNALLNFKSKLLALPNKLTPLIINAKNDNIRISEIIRTGVNEALSELAEYDPKEITGIQDNIKKTRGN